MSSAPDPSAIAYNATENGITISISDYGAALLLLPSALLLHTNLLIAINLDISRAIVTSSQKSCTFIFTVKLLLVIIFGTELTSP